LPRFDINCPRCDEGLLFSAKEGEDIACPTCEITFTIEGGQAMYDPDDLTIDEPEVEGWLEYVDLPTSVDEAAEAATAALARVREIAGPPAVIRSLIQQIRQAVALIKDSYNGRYDVSWSTVALLAAALLYVVLPADAIPDFFPFIGFTDDAAVMALVFQQVSSEIADYERWKARKKKRKTTRK
jgi:uncharacterized membrane protein YkvA (DUF1232 family)